MCATLGVLLPATASGAGRVVCWGSDGSGQSSPPDTVNGTGGTASAVAAAVTHSCAIRAETGAAVCWGSNSYGQASPPSSVNGATGTASAIAAGGWEFMFYTSYSCAIRAENGAVVCWGNNDYGQASPPDAVNGSSGGASAIATGMSHACAIQAGTGVVFCWSAFLDPNQTPDAVNGTDGTASAISAGYGSSCAIQAETGAVVCWGSNDYGQASPPDEVNGIDGTASALSGAWMHSCAIQAETGGVVCWGNNDYGQASPPVAVDGNGGTARAVATGIYHTCAIQAESGGVICWGEHSAAELSPPPEVNGTLGTASAIATGAEHVCAIQASDDEDEDGVRDGEDNCPSVANEGQADGDGDGIGDACDNCRKKRNDYPCPPGRTCSGGQLDDDYDGCGNLCDGDFTESANDGFCNVTDLLRFLDAFGKNISDNTCPDSAGDPTGPCARYDLSEDGAVVNVSDLLEMIDPEMFGTPTSEQGCAEDDTGVVRCPLEKTCGEAECPECSSDNDCPIAEICEADVCVDCICWDIWDPVCGVDGKTYSNSCYARCAHVKVAHSGECPQCSSDNDCLIGEICEQEICLACLCPDLWAPVCGADGNTYDNSCYARCAHIEVVHSGECVPD